MKRLEEQHESDKYQEAQGQHFHGRVLLDESTDPATEEHHYNDGDNHRQDHYYYLITVYNAYRCEDGVKREYDIYKLSLNNPLH